MSDNALFVGLCVGVVLLLHAVIFAPKILFSAAPKADTLGSRRNLHLNRRFQHFSTGIAIIALYHFCTRQIATQASLAGFLFMVSIHLLRRRWDFANRVFLRVCGSVLRPHELTEPPAALFFMAGVFVVTAFFFRHIACLAILNVSIGDPMAAIAGITLGGPKISAHKTWSGTIVGAVMCGFASVAYLMFYTPEFLPTSAAVSSVLLFTIVVAALAELVPAPKGLDDNLTIPIASGALLYIGAHLLNMHFLLVY
eukprot:GILK01004031.1.p1 GENE.GILK01004031.1~~GILK01004031.1.p1  ORF type:complete len:264 (-),score=14.06 GILK01004031.1:100-861(-)